jgi:hypothetical protein
MDVEDVDWEGTGKVSALSARSTSALHISVASTFVDRGVEA